MFSFLKFKMENSLGVPIEVKLAQENGCLVYEIRREKNVDGNSVQTLEFDKEGEVCQKQVLSEERTNTFIQKWEKISCNDMFQHLEQVSNAKENDFWFLEIGYDNLVFKMSGGKEGEASLSTFIQPLSELFDEVLVTTHFVKPSRVECIEIELYEPFEVPKSLAFLGNCGPYGHEEYVCLDRNSMTLSYSRKNPTRCVNHSYKCFCENEIRSILDRTSDLLESGNFLQENENCLKDDETCFQKNENWPQFKGQSPKSRTQSYENSISLGGAECLKNGTYVGFVFHFYDGNKKIVKRRRIKNSVGSVLLDELIGTIGSAIIFTLFDKGLFDFEKDL